MIDHLSLGALVGAFASGVKKVTTNDPKVSVTPLERTALYGVGMILLGLMTWVVVTTNQNAQNLVEEKLGIAQIQQTTALLQQQISRQQQDIQDVDKRTRNLEYKVFGR